MTPTATDPGLSARFARDGVERCWRGALAFCGFAAAMLILSALYSRFAEPAEFSDLLRIRTIALLAIAGVAWLLSTDRGARRPRELAVVLVAVMSVCLHELAQYTGGQASPQYDRLVFVVLGTAVLMSWNAGWGALACAVAVGIYVAGTAAAGQLDGPEFHLHLGRMLTASLVTIGANAMREGQRWRELLQVHTLTAARERAEAELRQLNEGLEQRVLERTAALRASEERFRAMFESAPIGVVTVDPSGAVLQANPAFAALLGRHPEGWAATRLDDTIHPDDRRVVAAALDELRDGRRPVVPIDVRYRRRNGTEVATHGALAAIRDEAGRFLCALGMAEDVTERLRAEEQAREHQEQLAHVLRMTTMGGMVAELAHELNQPLGAIVNFANGTSTRLRQSGADPALADAVASIAAEGMRAAEIIRRVREFVRPGGVPTERVDLNALVRESTQLIESDAVRHQIPIRLRLDPALPPLTLDRIHVEQVMLNLMRNAIDAMRAAPGDAQELVVETVGREADGVEVRVRDTGVGMPRGGADRIFEAFFTTKPNGLGMGLSISRSIVEAYGGRLWATSNADRGMTFAFTLPTTIGGASPHAAA